VYQTAVALARFNPGKKEKNNESVYNAPARPQKGSA
jgi:hypothetical protein